jgi:hypothetical protein
MNARRALIFAGSLWEIVRFFLVLSLLVVLFRAAGGEGSWIVPWILLGGTGNLLVAVGGIMLSVFPERHQGVVGLLRLGKAFCVFSFILLLSSGAIGMSPNIVLARAGRMAFTEGAALIAIIALDVLFLAVLLAYRPDRGERGIPGAPGGGTGLPEYPEAEVKDFH